MGFFVGLYGVVKEGIWKGASEGFKVAFQGGIDGFCTACIGFRYRVL